MTSRLGRFLLRVLAMAGKEILHIRRDLRTLYMTLAMPVLMMLLFGFGLSYDVDHIPLALIDGDRSEASRALQRRIFGSREFDRAGDVDRQAAEAMLRRGQASAVLVFPVGYGQALLAGRDGPVELLVDGTDANLARQITSKIDSFVLDETARRTGLTAAASPFSVRLHILFNPTARSAFFMVPGLAGYLMAIAAVLLTALTVAGEWERGSMEQLFASPIGRLEIVLGKLLPYLVLGMVQFLLVLAMAAVVFDVPVRGSVALLFLSGLVFLVGMLGQGLLISVVARNQLVATQAGALSALLPSLFLSGVLVPIENMPGVIQALTVVVPARYLVHALRTIMLKGGNLQIVAVDLAAMLAFAVVILALATLRFKRRLA